MLKKLAVTFLFVFSTAAMAWSTEMGFALNTARTISKTDSVSMAALQLVAKVPDQGVQDGQAVHDALG